MCMHPFRALIARSRLIVRAPTYAQPSYLTHPTAFSARSAQAQDGGADDEDGAGGSDDDAAGGDDAGYMGGLLSSMIWPLHGTHGVPQSSQVRLEHRHWRHALVCFPARVRTGLLLLCLSFVYLPSQPAPPRTPHAHHAATEQWRRQPRFHEAPPRPPARSWTPAHAGPHGGG